MFGFTPSEATIICETAMMHIGGSQEEQNDLYTDIHRKATEGEGRLTYGGVVRAVRDVSTSEQFRKVFGENSLEKDRQLFDLFSHLQKEVLFTKASGRDFGGLELLDRQQKELASVSRPSADKGEEEPPEAVESAEPPRSESSEPVSISELSVQDLVHDFETREWDDQIEIFVAGTPEVVRGYVSPDYEVDKELLLQLAERHNAMFPNRAEDDEVYDPAGVVERLDVAGPSKTGPGDVLYVRADLHGDLGGLLAQLRMHQKGGDLDENFRCRPGFHIIFLGDYMDRGANDIEVLSLLLSLHMANPTSVHLLRGNHEDLSMSSWFSNEGEWMNRHADAFGPLFQNFPLALCAGVPGEGAPEFVHFSHGLFPTWVDLFPLLEKGSRPYMPIPKNPVLSDEPSRPLEQKLRPAWERMWQLVTLSPNASGYTWSDVGKRTGPSTRGDIRFSRESGCVLSPSDIYSYGRVAGMGVATIPFFVRGHQHYTSEMDVSIRGNKQVVVMTLPIGVIGGMFPIDAPSQRRQGVFFTVGEKVENWKKSFAIVFGEGSKAELIAQTKQYKMHERMLSVPK